MGERESGGDTASAVSNVLGAAAACALGAVTPETQVRPSRGESSLTVMSTDNLP